jgi:hypothetical protein
MREGIVDGWALWSTVLMWALLRYAAIGVSWIGFATVLHYTAADTPALWPFWLGVFPCVQTIVVPAVNISRNRVAGILSEQHFLRRRSLYLCARPECAGCVADHRWSYLDARRLWQQNADLSLVIAVVNMLVQTIALGILAGTYSGGDDEGAATRRGEFTQAAILSFVTAGSLASSTGIRVCCIKGAFSVREYFSNAVGDEDEMMLLMEIAATAATLTARDSSAPMTPNEVRGWATRVYPGWSEHRHVSPPIYVTNVILGASPFAPRYLSALCTIEPTPAQTQHSIELAH